jgi:putative ATPase
MKDIGYGKDYKYAHQYEGNFVPENYLPEDVKGSILYQPQQNAREKELIERFRNQWKDFYEY